MPFSALETRILTAKGITPEHLEALAEAGVSGKEELKVVGDAATLCELIPAIDTAVADRVMAWAAGQNAPSSAMPFAASATPTGKVILDTADVVYCAHCSAKQPKDYKSGDLCVACGRQAEPIRSCFWCSASGPGGFCRSCGAKFVPPAELDLAGNFATALATNDVDSLKAAVRESADPLCRAVPPGDYGAKQSKIFMWMPGQPVPQL